MRQGLYELQVVDQTGVPFRERSIAGNNYVEAVSGLEYRVRVSIHRDESGRFPMQYAIVCLYVDGAKLNYTMRMTIDEDNSEQKATHFVGFREGSNLYQAFVFTLPSGLLDNTDIKCETGLLKVEIFAATTSSEVCGHPIPNDTPSAPTAIENKKPTDIASLGTVPGRTITCGRPSLGPVYVWRKVRAQPEATLEVKCHTAENLNFIQMVHDDRANRLIADRTPMDLTATSEQQNHVKTESGAAQRGAPSTAAPASSS